MKRPWIARRWRIDRVLGAWQIQFAQFSVRLGLVQGSRSLPAFLLAEIRPLVLHDPLLPLLQTNCAGQQC